jgi:hypothetical protein
LDYVGFEDIPNSKHYTLEEQWLKILLLF